MMADGSNVGPPAKIPGEWPGNIRRARSSVVEQKPFKLCVEGSIPSGLTRFHLILC